MTKPRYTEERFMPILWTLYQRTSNGNEIIRYGDFCKEFNISNAIFPILEKNKVLMSTPIPSVTGRGRMQKVYVWNTFQPNIHMAKKLMEELKKRSQASTEQQREKREMLKRQQELELLQDEQLQQEQLQQEQKWEVIDMPNPTIAPPRIETEAELNATTTQSIQNPFQTVTISSDQPLPQVKKATNKKKFSIAWGLISIEW
jgi:hypothetical protein